jgi:DNA-binding LytR/AlgR family response regulator
MNLPADRQYFIRIQKSFVVAPLRVEWPTQQPLQILASKTMYVGRVQMRELDEALTIKIHRDLNRSKEDAKLRTLI